MNRKAFTLIEILVAMSIFAMLLTMASMGFSGVFKQSARVNLERKLQEDSRFLMEKIVKEIRNNQIDFASHYAIRNFGCGDDSETPDSDCYSAYIELDADQIDPAAVSALGEETLYLLSPDGLTRSVLSKVTTLAHTAATLLKQNYLESEDIENTYNWTPALTESAEISPEEITINELKFYISPISDPYKFNEVSEIQMQPTVTVLLDTQLDTTSDKVPDFFLGDTPSLSLQTTITSRYYDTIDWQITEVE